ncbi:MAG: phospholipid carrier-dependent glycosyltransferase [Candidatus Sungbacteria bacterium]|nr:phospholipid carrier-dependent glycosyltransferase [Candidatus Sungbacteria bacterium]
MAYPIFKIIKRPIFWILFLALFLRLGGIAYGFPLFLVKDEPALIYGALKMAELKTLVPALHQDEFKKVLYYPPGPSYFYLIGLAPFVGIHYLLSGLPPFTDYKNTLAVDPGFIWLIGRVFNAFFGIANIFLVYLLARKLFQSEKAGLFAALFLAVSFYHLQLSQVVRHWMPAALLIYAVWFLSAKIAAGEGGSKIYAAIGILLGVSVGGINTASVVGLVPFMLAHFFRPATTPFWKKIVDRKFIFSILLFALISLIFVALYPYGFTRAEGASGPSVDVVQRLSGLADKSILGLIEFVWFYTKLLLRYETILFVFALLGAAFLFFKRNPRWVLGGALFVVLYLALLYSFFNPIPRGLIFILPLFAVFAGHTADVLWNKLVALAILQYSAVLKYLITALFVILFFGWQSVTDFRYDWLIFQPDTRLEASAWVARHILEGEKILADSQYLRIPNTKEGIKNLERIDSGALRAADYARLRFSDELYPKPAYHFLNLHFVSRDSQERKISDAEFFRKQGFRYFIVEYDYFDRRDLDPRSAALVRQSRLVARFDNGAGQKFETATDAGGEIATISLADLFRIQRLGKFVEIYEL